MISKKIINNEEFMVILKGDFQEIPKESIILDMILKSEKINYCELNIDKTKLLENGSLEVWFNKSTEILYFTPDTTEEEVIDYMVKYIGNSYGNGTKFRNITNNKLYNKKNDCIVYIIYCVPK